MLSLLIPLLLAQTPTAPPPEPQTISVPQQVYPLPGELDQVPVFNSNSPELVQTEGILLSTFPTEGKAVPDAHLDYRFNGRFDVFAHHVARAPTPDDLRTLYLGVVLHNPGLTTVTVDVLQAASYLSQPDAPFIQLPPMVDNPRGTVYAGPGSRVMSDILRGQRQEGWPAQIAIPPGESRLLMNAPIPVSTLDPPINGRSTLARLRSNGSVYAASLARYAPTDAAGNEREPTLEEWQQLLATGSLAGPRDRTPTPPGEAGQLIYGRVAGVAIGSTWNAQVQDANHPQGRLSIPAPGESKSYLLSGLDRGTFGTGQIQSAPLVVRYPDTAYAAHGNYGIHYRVHLPLHNRSEVPQRVAVTLQTPLKTDEARSDLQFLEPLPSRVFFRGTVRVRYRDDQGVARTRYVHLVQQQGQQGEPLVILNLDPDQANLVQVDFLYPPDATPPQALTLQGLSLD
ncbi:DUF3370 family protein [Synechococcales cyanobacterium C]|uniref:DUF3370 family protein n=1 Tax=Petrachloros mirabilis ULC683 TaxID=2781853 RepID=A0A8K2A7B3_9CYAN|nr:DUF3370 domain-containing protein [Petrachloros mirabilis]NCJ05890.1 DUF3370 family protein [Petrachloros mirabilis ULC683]